MTRRERWLLLNATTFLLVGLAGVVYLVVTMW
jgi:hypothetical protein